MAGVLTTKVRLVRCPKCKLLLPELPDFNVYKCGGCGATLIAKHRVNIPDPNETRTDCASEEKEEHRSSNKDVAPCSGECSSSQNDESDQSKSGDCDSLNFPKKDSNKNNNNNGIRRSSDASDFYNEGSEISSEVYSPTEFFDDKSEDFAQNRVSEPANDDLSGSEFDLFGHNENENEEFARNENDESSHDENEEERFRAEAENESSMSLSLAIADEVEPRVSLGSLSLAEKSITEDTIYKKSDCGYDYDYDYVAGALKQPQSSAHRGYSRNQSHELRGAYLGETSSKSPARLSRAYGGTENYDEATDIRREKFMAQAMMRNSWLDKNNNNNTTPGSRNWRPEREREHQMGSYEKFQRHSSFQSHFSEDPENVVKFLRMVLQVQKQSSKSGSLYETGPSQKPMYEYDPRYHHHHHHHNFDAPQRDQHQHQHHQFGYLDDPRNLGRYASGSNYTNRPRPKKIPFSDQLDPSCSHCFPKERAYYNNPSRLHPRPAPKRHFRPVARGAPFVVCHRCRNVLLLPADFLLFKRKRHHRLRCGACSQILEFSLEKGSHIVGLGPKLAGPPPPPPPSSLVEPPPSSPITQSQTPRDSFDHGRSNNDHKSFSVEEEDRDQGPSTPAPTPLGRAFDRIIFGVSYPPEDSSSELVPEPSRGRYKDRPPRHESSRPASKVTKPRVDDDDDDDDGDQRSTSPLHRLMGYSSPSQVIYGSRPYGLGGSSNSFSIRREQY